MSESDNSERERVPFGKVKEGPPFADFDEAAEYFAEMEPSPLCFPEEESGINSIDCPECGREIEAPWGGHLWTCHEDYGGCGAKFRPAKVFVRVQE